MAGMSANQGELDLLLKEIGVTANLLRARRPDVDVAPQALRALALLESAPLTVPALAQSRGTSRQNMQVIANGFVRRGLAEFLPNPRHKRSRLLSITASGRALVASFSARNGSWPEALSERLSPDKIALVRDALRFICEQFGGHLAGGPKKRTSPSPQISVQSHDVDQKPEALAASGEGELPVSLL